MLLTLARVQVLERDPRQDGKQQVRSDAPHCGQVNNYLFIFCATVDGGKISLTSKKFEEYQIIKTTPSRDTSVEKGRWREAVNPKQHTHDE